MSPLSEPEYGQRALDLRRFLEEFVGREVAEPLAWIALPAEASRQTLVGARKLAPVPDDPRIGSVRAILRSVRDGRRQPAQSAGYWSMGDVLFEVDGVNHRRSLEPIMRQLADPVPVPDSGRAGPLRMAAVSRRGVRLADRLVREARAGGLWLGRDPERLRWAFASAGRYLAHSEALLRSLSPRAVVVASTTNVPTRALIQAARAQGTPSVFFPHAPLLADPFYNDLPVDRVGLRGEREAELFAGWGVDRSRLDVVGNTTLRERPMPELDYSLPPVFAPPVNPPDRLPGLVEMVREVLGDAVTVSPHPRADMDLLGSLMPAGWTLWERRTAELLEQGPPFLLQHSSGVALEALQLGIPTIELVLAGAPTTYPLIREPYVHVASTSGELSGALQAARADAADESGRTALREWARGWSSSDEHTVERAAELVQQAAYRDPAEGPIWDVWRSDEQLQEFSTLTGG